VAAVDKDIHKSGEEGQDNPGEQRALSVLFKTPTDKRLHNSKEIKSGTEASISPSSNKTNQVQTTVDPEELLSMVVVTDPTDDVIYIQLPPDSEGGAMEQYCESVFFPTEGDTFLSVEDFNKRQCSVGDRNASNNNIGCETTVMLPLRMEDGEEIDETEEAKDGEQMVLIKGMPVDQNPERENKLDEEMSVITVPGGGAAEYLTLSQHKEDADHTQEEPEGYQNTVTQSLEDSTPEGMTTAQQQQQRYLVIFN
jgi:hypothetical protein